MAKDIARVQGGQVIFNDFTDEVNEQILNIIDVWLEEAGSELSSQVAKRSRRGTGQTAGWWGYKVDTNKHEAYVGNPLENAIWEEFGTGEYALNGDGRKGGWIYFDETKKKFYHTYGKTPNRALHNTFNIYQEPLKDQLRNQLKGMK